MSVDFHPQSYETIIAELIKTLGFYENKDLTPDKLELIRIEINKMFSQLTESEREMLMWYLDLWNTYGFDFLKTYIYDFLKLSVSLDRKGREEIAELGKAPLQMQNPANMSRWDRLKQLGSIFG